MSLQEEMESLALQKNPRRSSDALRQSFSGFSCCDDPQNDPPALSVPWKGYCPQNNFLLAGAAPSWHTESRSPPTLNYLPQANSPSIVELVSGRFGLRLPKPFLAAAAGYRESPGTLSWDEIFSLESLISSATYIWQKKSNIFYSL
jgi:hypothetical protein